MTKFLSTSDREAIHRWHCILLTINIPMRGMILISLFICGLFQILTMSVWGIDSRWLVWFYGRLRWIDGCCDDRSVQIKESRTYLWDRRSGVCMELTIMMWLKWVHAKVSYMVNWNGKCLLYPLLFIFVFNLYVLQSECVFIILVAIKGKIFNFML